MIYQVQFKIFLVNAFGFQFEYPHFLKLETYAAAVTQGTIAFIKMRFYVGYCAHMVVGKVLLPGGNPSRTISFIEDFIVVHLWHRRRV